jgi:hypothetical protein
MATSGWETLGSVLGGGVDKVGAYETGRLRTAQTENALIQARNRQLEGVSLEAKNKARFEAEDVLVKSGKSPEEARLLATIMNGEMGADYKAGTEGLLNTQEQDFRATLGNAEAPLGEQFAAGQGVQGKALNPYDAVGAGGYADLRNPDAGVQNTPLGESMIAENDATTQLRNVQAGDPDYSTVSGGGTTAGGPGKPPSGFVANPAFDPSKPISEGNYAFTDARAPVMGAREAVFFNRIVGGAKNAQQTIKNIVDLKVGASAGVLGIGSKPGDSMWKAGIDTLRNTVSDQTVQTYNTMIAGLDANLAQIEGHGLASSDAFRGQYDRLALREGDTEFTRLRKLAEMAQTIESGLDPYLNNPRIPVQQRQYMQDLVAMVRQTIPFTHADIAALEVDPNATTLGDLIRSKGLDQAASGARRPTGAAPAPAAGVTSQPLPPRNAQGWELLEDAEGNLAYVSPDGTQIEEVPRPQ